jgi:hypothetical protein
MPVDAEKTALEHLRRHAGGVRWRAARGRGADILGADEHGARFVTQVKRLQGSNRADKLKGAAAMAVLALQRAHPDAHPLVVLIVDRLGASAVDQLGEYLHEVAPDIGWGVFDTHGGARLSIPRLDLAVNVEPDIASPAPTKSTPPLFSDLNTWMLKLLLMRRAPTWAWTATRQECRNARALHLAADVSGATAHRFVKAMGDADFLRRDRRGLQLVRVETLLRMWRSVHQSQPPALIEVRPLFEFNAHALGTTLAGGRVAIGGQSAAEHFTLAHATHGRRTIWVEADLDAALEALDVVPVEPGRGELWIGRPRLVESCFRARVIEGGMAFVDPCELMLESSIDPTRGFEQAEYIAKRILAWQEDDNGRDQ